MQHFMVFLYISAVDGKQVTDRWEQYNGINNCATYG